MRLRRLVCFITAVSIVPLVGGTGDAAASPVPVYVFAGQSNMVGSSAKAAELPALRPGMSAPQPRALFWGPTADSPKGWFYMEAPTEVWQATYRSGFGPEVSAAHRLSAKNKGREIGIVKYARNSTNLSSHWNPSNSSGLYRRLMTRVNEARAALSNRTGRPTRVAAFFWMQGESDTASYSKAMNYGKNLRSLISAVRRDTRNPTLPVIIGQIPPVNWWYKTHPHAPIVRQKQLDVARSDPHTYWVKTDGLKRDPLSPAHFDTKGILDLGIRMTSLF